ncbi:hypothetical protein J6590_107404 [Homalodisca vitripennis]|nr:hypothetical protein J6590_107404 [Homalodisca vitripennis]
MDTYRPHKQGGVGERVYVCMVITKSDGCETSCVLTVEPTNGHIPASQTGRCGREGIRVYGDLLSQMAAKHLVSDSRAYKWTHTGLTNREVGDIQDSSGSEYLLGSESENESEELTPIKRRKLKGRGILKIGRRIFVKSNANVERNT